MPTGNLRVTPLPIPPPVGGVIEDVDDPKILKPGALAEGENLVPERAPRLATRGGSRVMLVLHAGESAVGPALEFRDTFSGADGDPLRFHTPTPSGGPAWEYLASASNDRYMVHVSDGNLVGPACPNQRVTALPNISAPATMARNAYTVGVGETFRLSADVYRGPVDFVGGGATFYAYVRDTAAYNDRKDTLTLEITRHSAVSVSATVRYISPTDPTGTLTLILGGDLTHVGDSSRRYILEVDEGATTVRLYRADAINGANEELLGTGTLPAALAAHGSADRHVGLEIGAAGSGLVYFSMSNFEVNTATSFPTAQIDAVLACAAKAATGAVLVAWSAGTTKHYAWAVTSDMAFAGATELLSQTAFPSSWNRATTARPVLASLFEKLYVADATPTYASRNPMAVIDAIVPPGIAVPTYEFVAGGAAAAALRPYCLEEYNNGLFVAGYGDEETGAGDDPALVRHSFLGKDPAASDGFDKDAYNTIGAKGDRVTAMKKGRGLLLIAKANELYRLSGFGRAYPGWQYQVDGVANTEGFGVENPLALEHAEGWWFGVGKQGPFRTDGYQVESLMGPRQRTWKGIDKLDKIWVRYHAERRLMLFGVHAVSGAPDTTNPWVLLCWDMARDVWQPNWRMAGNTRLYVGAMIATTTTAAPGAAPTGLSTTSITTSGWTANWTNGDATAETEVWVRDVTAGGSWLLVTAVAAGIASYAVTSRIGHNSYQWKLRHRKNGIYSAYTADQSVQTLITAPIALSTDCLGFGHQINAIVYQADPTTTGTLERSPAGAGTWTVVGTFTGDSHAFLVSTAGASTDLRAKSSDAGWPMQDSAYLTQSGIVC
jgi:hypothetical protein